jgi:hypothetical protein
MKTNFPASYPWDWLWFLIVPAIALFVLLPVSKWRRRPGLKQSLKKMPVDAGVASLIVALLWLAAYKFDSLSSVWQARTKLPAEFGGSSCDCFCVLDSRPWYGQVNPWFWLWVVCTPLIVFSAGQDAPVWRRALRTLIAIGLGHIAVNLSVKTMWEIRNIPFTWAQSMHHSREQGDFLFNCIDIGDGGSLGFALLFGWLYTAIYAGWWEIIWHQYHKRKTKLIDKDFKTDWISEIVIFISIAIPALLAVYAGMNWLRH